MQPPSDDVAIVLVDSKSPRPQNAEPAPENLRPAQATRHQKLN
jgi:hypothetical protein